MNDAETIDDVKQAYALLFKAHGALVSERDELASRVSELEGENDRLIKALADCRNAFPIPEPGAQAENEWMQAMGCPESVPEFVRAALAAQPGSVGEPVASVRVEGGMMRGATRRPGMASLPDGDHKLYAAAPTAVEPDERDTERMNWLDNNIFHVEPDQWTRTHHPHLNTWRIFAPKGVQGSARAIIDAARASKGTPL